jgi:hypothetical protein
MSELRRHLRRVIAQATLVIWLATMSASFAGEEPRMDFVKRIAPEYLGKYKKIGTANTVPDCEITEATIKLVGFGEYKMTSLIHVTPLSGPDFYSAYLDDPKETWINLRKMDGNTVEVQFREKITQKILRSETYVQLK